MLRVLAVTAVIQLSSLTAVVSIFFYEEVEVVSSSWTLVPVAVRQIEFMGGSDNGTLDCSIPGFTHYRWQIINKASTGPYAESSSLILDGKVRPHQSIITIGNGGFPMATELIVVSCEALINEQPRFQIIWILNRLPLPLGYITDPRICNFGAKSWEDSACVNYKSLYKSNCFYGDGRDYRGTAYTTKSAPPGICQYWFLNMPNKFSSSYSGKLDKNKGEHRYCRNPSPHSYWKPWCATMSTSENAKRQYCHVQECSECIYGNGDGSFDLYPGRKFPEYKGRGITSLKEDENGLPRTCMAGKGWEKNTCRLKKGVKRPHCYIARKKSDESVIKHFSESDSRLQFVECRIPQCTVRQVWFLFFDSFGRPYLTESNYDPVEIVMVNGRRSEIIKFGAFGIHLASGLSVGTEDSKLTKFPGTFKLSDRVITRKSPGPLSSILVKNVEKKISGIYFVQYTFAEANPKIQQSIYKAKFKITVRDPTTFSISPKVLHLCLGEKGTLTLQIFGGFDVLDNSIKWKYGTLKTNISREILADDASFDLAPDFRKVTLKAIKRDTWISAEGDSYSGHTMGFAQFKLKAQPDLKASSSDVLHSPLGGYANLTLEVERNVKTTWTYDAQIIPDVPDDPNMAFQRILKENIIVESLIISDLDWRHFGMYIVDAVKDGCKETLTFHIMHEKENETILKTEELISTTRSPTTTNPPTNYLLNQEYCTIYPLNLRKLDKGKEFANLTIDLRCNDNEEQSSLPDEPSPVQMLPSCCAVTSYQFLSNASTPHKLLLGGRNSEKLAEYKGNVEVQLNFIKRNNIGWWRIVHNFPEPVVTRYLQFISVETRLSFHLSKLQITGCPVDESHCTTNASLAEDLTCNRDEEFILYNELPRHELPPCSVVTGYQFAAEASIPHSLLLSSESALLKKYEGEFQHETRYMRGNATGKWKHIYKFSEPVAARFVQFISDNTGDSPCMDQVQIGGCTLDETMCSLEWFKTSSFSCTGQNVSLANEPPVYGLRRCSLITSYEFAANATIPHRLLHSESNPRRLLELDREIYTESKVIKKSDHNQWRFFYIFAEPFPTRFLQFFCNQTGETNDTSGSFECLRELQINGCPVADSMCDEDWFKIEVEEQVSKVDFFETTTGQVLLGMVFASVLFVVAMFLAAEYDLENLLDRIKLKLQHKNKLNKHEQICTSSTAGKIEKKDN